MLIADTPNQISYVQLASVKQMIKLEKLGMKMSRGANVRKTWALYFGLKANAKHDDVIAKIQEKMDSILHDIKAESVVCE